MPTLSGERRQGSCKLATRKGIPVYEEQWHFEVVADYTTQTRVDIITTDGLPIPGVNTTADGFALCKTLNATRSDQNSLYWHVVATFSSEVEEDQLSNLNQGQPNSNPLEWVPVYETKFERLQEVVTKDQSGDAVANSAGQAFETGLTISRFIPVWEFYQFESDTVSDETIIERHETVNATEFKGRAAKTLLLSIMESVIWRYLGQRMRLTKYSLKYNEKDWQHKRLDVGTQYKSGATLLDFTSDSGSIMLGSLDGSGAKQAAGDPPAILAFDLFATSEFNDFLRL